MFPDTAYNTQLLTTIQRNKQRMTTVTYV